MKKRSFRTGLITSLCLIAVGLSSFASPAHAGGGAPSAMVVGSDGALWFTRSGATEIVKTIPYGSSEHYSLLVSGSTIPPTSSPSSPSQSVNIPGYMVVGSDKNIWLTDKQAPVITRVTPEGQTTHYSAVPAGARLSCATAHADHITAGPDSALWFTLGDCGVIGRLTTQGQVRLFTIPKSKLLTGITVGPDRALWFTDQLGGTIGRLTTDARVQTFMLPQKSQPYAIQQGPDRNLWFADLGDVTKNAITLKIGRITPQGKVSEFAVPHYQFFPDVLAADTTSLWFPLGTAIGRITTQGKLTIFPLPAQEQTSVATLTVDPHGDGVWFLDHSASTRIGRMTASGKVSLYPVS